MDISGLFCHSDFTRNQFWSIWSHQKCHSHHLSSSEWELLTFSKVNFFQKSKFKASKLLKWQCLTFWNQPKLISHKIRVAGKWLNFLTVEYPKSKFPIRLPRSVLINDIWQFRILIVIQIGFQYVFSVYYYSLHCMPSAGNFFICEWNFMKLF